LPSQHLTEIVGPEFLRDAAEADVIDGMRPRWIVEPGTPSEIARILATANERGLSVIPRGGGTKLSWGNSPRSADVVLSLHRLNQVLEHAAGDMTVTVEAGCTIAVLQSELAKRGQRLVLDPLWPEQATVGGVLATGDCGMFRWRFGSPRDLVLGVTVALADGTLARSGGKVVKNVAGYDLPKLFTGSFGTLGVITQATFRLHPIPSETRHLSFHLPSDGIGRFITAMRERAELTSAVQICAADEGAVSAGVLVEGLREAADSKTERVFNAAVAAGATHRNETEELQSLRERVFEAADAPFVVGRISVPPAELDRVFSLLRDSSTCPVHWRAVAQAVGTALIRLEAADDEALVIANSQLRAALAAFGGTFVILRCPAGMKGRLDVWGEPGDTLALMKRIKAQFDPAGILNPGRFVGGI
jgi:glycolate oxidase FAD binding subunit